VKREFIFWGKITDCNPTPFQWWFYKMKYKLHGLITGHKVKEVSRAGGWKHEYYDVWGSSGKLNPTTQVTYWVCMDCKFKG
jgi:hypothetical protein